MRYFRLSTLALPLALAPLMAMAQSAPATQPQAQGQQQAAPAKTSKPVDRLFEALKRERNPEKAKGISMEIMQDLTDSGSPTVNLLMEWSATAMKEKKNGAALDFLDRITLLNPGYVEAWNRRATIHYAMGNQRKSMADIAEVLKREPRHFQALAGLAGIMAESGRDELALKAWQDYLAVYPADREAQEAMTKLSEKLAGNRT